MNVPKSLDVLAVCRLCNLLSGERDYIYPILDLSSDDAYRKSIKKSAMDSPIFEEGHTTITVLEYRVRDHQDKKESII